MTSAPEICGCYSIKDGVYDDSITLLQYYIEPKLPIDLNRGLKKLREIPDSFYERKLDRLLTFLVKHKREYLTKSESAKEGDRLIPSTLYINSRSVLQNIFCSPINPWTILATRYKGNIYLCKHHQKRPENDISKKFTNYGLVFENSCFSERPNGTPNASKISGGDNHFYCVFKRNMVNRQFLFSAEMDGTDSKTPLNLENPKEWKPNQFVETKLTTKKYSFEKFKIHTIWAQSYLSGVEKVHIGFRNDRGIVYEMGYYSIDTLKQISQRNWTCSMSGLELLNEILEKFETDLEGIDCPHTTIKYEYKYDEFKEPIDGLSSTRYDGESDYSFLPKWYFEEMKLE